jgi:N-acetylmuramoyl-L-alanine amidase CwlA
MQSNENDVSYHFAVDDKEAVQGIPFDRNAWHAGDGGKGSGNRKGIGIEICYSKSGGDRFIKAERNAAELVANILRENGWGIDAVRKHQDFSGKYCPHRTLDMGWERFLGMVRAKLEDSVDYADLVCEKCGFEEQTREYLDSYKYAGDLWRKLWDAMKGE